jgi:hypothetical protein
MIFISFLYTIGTIKNKNKIFNLTTNLMILQNNMFDTSHDDNGV